MAETAVRFEGHENRECGEHRTLGGRAWCFDCSEYCSPEVPCTRCELPSLRKRLILAESAVATRSVLHNSAEGDVSAVHALVARWQEGVANLYAANEEEAVPETRKIRAARAAQIECCIWELREALAAPSPVSAATGETGEERT